MIKEKLMKALKNAVETYNSGSGANAAIVKAAEDYDFNENQADRLVEMFNTLAALNKEKDACDPTGSCELADKKEVRKMLLGDSMNKAAESGIIIDNADYSFYATDPDKTNRTIEARNSGIDAMFKAASVRDEINPELDISQRSLYKVISEKINLVKSAADAAGDAIVAINSEIDKSVIKIAKAIEDSFAHPDIADMFKAACTDKAVVDLVGEYSTKVAESNGGRFSELEVFDSSLVDDLLKIASNISDLMKEIPGYERKKSFYLSKAAEAEDSIKNTLRLKKVEKKASVADFFNPDSAINIGKVDSKTESNPADSGNVVTSLYEKIAKAIRNSGVKSEEVEKLAEDFEKNAAIKSPAIMAVMPSPFDAADALRTSSGLTDEEAMFHNIDRGLILDDLMANDPIIRDADPNVVLEVYRSLVRSSPRISMDKALVRSVLRSAVNSVAISPADVKMLTDVDKGMALANVERLTNLDSSVKDSNRV